LPGGKSRLSVERDATVNPNSKPATITLVGEIPGSVLILTDVYPSIAGGLSYCQAGTESFLRVISTSGKRLHETYSTKLESCHDNIELASPGVKWLSATNTLEIHWLSAPGKAGQTENRTLVLGANGKPQ